jgi:predicted RNA-binding protein with PIN domain
MLAGHVPIDGRTTRTCCRLEAVWVIDAFNVLGSRPDGWWRNRALALARLCDAIAEWRDDREVIVVIDGWPGPEVPERHWRGVDVRYARRRGPDGADRAIVDLVVEADDPAALTVVTSDARLREQVLARGASVEGAGTFRARLHEPG